MPELTVTIRPRQFPSGGIPTAPSANPCWIMMRPEWAGPVGDDQALIRFAQRAAPYGYNGFVLWDSDFSRPVIPDYAKRLYTTTAGWCSQNGWSMVAEICPTNSAILRWPGTDHSMMENGHGDFICLADPRVHPIYDQIVGNVLALLPQGSPLVGLMASYDEFRLQGTHPRCHKPGGPLLAEHAKKTLDIFRARAPNLRRMVWSDMFDPLENAKTPYYQVYQGMAGAEAGIAGDVTIINWSAKLASFQFFANLGCPQVCAGYYDWPGGNDGDCFSPTEEDAFNHSVAPYAQGYMYTTWVPKWAHLREYAFTSQRVPWRPWSPPAPPPPPPPDGPPDYSKL